jgi:hypothetical protein
MKRIHTQQSDQSVVLEEDVPLDNVTLSSSQPHREIKQLPTSDIIHGSGLKRIKSFKEIKKNYKMQNQLNIFSTDMSQLLSHLDVNSNRYNTELMIEVCSAAELFFVFGNKEEREASIDCAVKELLLPFFQNDLELMQTMRASVAHKIVKSSAARRLFQKTKFFFKKILKILLT